MDPIASYTENASLIGTFRTSASGNSVKITIGKDANYPLKMMVSEWLFPNGCILLVPAVDVKGNLILTEVEKDVVKVLQYYRAKNRFLLYEPGIQQEIFRRQVRPETKMADVKRYLLEHDLIETTRHNTKGIGWKLLEYRQFATGKAFQCKLCFCQTPEDMSGLHSLETGEMCDGEMIEVVTDRSLIQIPWLDAHEGTS